MIYHLSEQSDLATNLHLLRDHLNTSDLIFEEMTVGSRAKIKVVLAYLDGVTNPDYVNTVKQRVFGMLFSIFATSFYVAILTFHFEVVPKDLLGPIIYSRANVPFPPVIEVLFLEITIDLLREAGARLPTKIGQTLGIVGGIVIGQATVEAALTSNILLIAVALAALSSFTTPIYKMSNAVPIKSPFSAWSNPKT